MNIDILTLFPKVIEAIVNESILKRAREKEIIKINTRNIRDWIYDKNKKADDSPYGGGPGMVLKPEPIFSALDEIKKENSRIILPTPTGKKFDYIYASELTKEKHLIFICGHYEGIDDRVRTLVTDEISIGDYVLTGGELPVLVVIDAVVRLLPGSLGDDTSAINDSFSGGLLDCPHWTRPAFYRGMKVPEILLSGNHEEIKKYRRRKSLEITYERRKDLLEKTKLTEEDIAYLNEIGGM